MHTKPIHPRVKSSWMGTWLKASCDGGLVTYIRTHTHGDEAQWLREADNREQQLPSFPVKHHHHEGNNLALTLTA